MNFTYLYLTTTLLPVLATTVALYFGGWLRKVYVWGSRLLLGATLWSWRRAR